MIRVSHLFHLLYRTAETLLTPSLPRENMDLNYFFLGYILVSILTLGSCKPKQKIKNQKSITMSKPTKSSSNDWKPKKPKENLQSYPSKKPLNAPQ